MISINVILMALVVGSLATDKAAQDAYKVLNGLIQQKLQGKTRPTLVLSKFAADPEMWEQPLRTVLTEAEADKDQEIVKVAQDLVLSAPEEVLPEKYLPSLSKVRSDLRPKFPALEEELQQEDYTGYRGWDDEIRETPLERASVIVPRQSEGQKRWINAQFLNHDWASPLQLGTIYTLAFTIDTTQLDVAVSTEFEEIFLFRRVEKQVKLTVHLTSRDFEVYTREPQTLIVPRTGKSKNTVRFDIEPLTKGIGEISVYFSKDNNFIQGMTLKVAVEEPAGKAIISREKLGRPVDGAFAVQPRDISLIIKDVGNAFNFTLIAGTVVAEATVAITLVQLNKMIAKLRKAMADVVRMTAQTNTIAVYQAGIDIPPEVNQRAMQSLARAGFELYQEIFYSANADAQTNLLGDKLRELSQQERLKIQIVSQQFLLPWGVLYMSEDYPDQVDANMFWGFKHIIEHIPLQQSLQVLDNEMKSYPILHVSLNLNKDIDRQMRMTVISDQEMYWQNLSPDEVKVVKHTKGNDALQDFMKNDIPYQLIYFYCHAATQSLDDDSGPDGSYVMLSNETTMTLGELKTRAPIKKGMVGAPLIFLNACESAELSPLFYGGFMPYFTAKGARGMIGTECDIPAQFAALWAQNFFNRFLQGQKSLGEIFLELRCEFLEKHHNLLGLLYALYCDGDTRVVPGLQIL